MIESILFSREILTRLERAITICFVTGLNQSEVPRHVITMGIATIMESSHCLLLANGAKKADAIRKMIEGPISASCPASILQMHPRVTVVLDEEAAYLLTFKDHYKWVGKNKLERNNKL